VFHGKTLLLNSRLTKLAAAHGTEHSIPWTGDKHCKINNFRKVPVGIQQWKEVPGCRADPYG